MRSRAILPMFAGQFLGIAPKACRRARYCTMNSISIMPPIVAPGRNKSPAVRTGVVHSSCASALTCRDGIAWRDPCAAPASRIASKRAPMAASPAQKRARVRAWCSQAQADSLLVVLGRCRRGHQHARWRRPGAGRCRCRTGYRHGVCVVIQVMKRWASLAYWAGGVLVFIVEQEDHVEIGDIAQFLAAQLAVRDRRRSFGTSRWRLCKVCQARCTTVGHDHVGQRRTNGRPAFPPSAQPARSCASRRNSWAWCASRRMSSWRSVSPGAVASWRSSSAAAASGSEAGAQRCGGRAARPAGSGAGSGTWRPSRWRCIMRDHALQRMPGIRSAATGRPSGAQIASRKSSRRPSVPSLLPALLRSAARAIWRQGGVDQCRQALVRLASGRAGQLAALARRRSRRCGGGGQRRRSRGW